mmetsp:Transcript_17044/g.28908  ORF Transcript_17044/g.28908 Transcript_17044/m.28908 type:complete len:449 (+) Transcript_17044:82-1428(+)
MTLPRGRERRGHYRGYLLMAFTAIGAYFVGLKIDITTILQTKDEASHGLEVKRNSSIDNSDETSELHRPVAKILNNPKIPTWVKNYVEWHKQQRQKYFDDMRAHNTSDVRFLISRCFKNDNCGGLSDRLQDMPYNLMLANQTKRVLLVRWERPTKLEHFLVPHAINWTVPDDMFPEDTDWDRSLVKTVFPEHGQRSDIDKEAHSDEKILSTIRDFEHLIFREYEENIVGHRIYHEIFRLLFSPSDALSSRIQSTMKSLNLMPNQYSSVHLRMQYPVDVIKNDGGFSFERQKSLITGWATNAVNCAANLHPNAAKYYVSSDSSQTIKYLLEESRFVQNYTDATKHQEHQSAVKLVARDYSIENPHIDEKNLEPDQFMSVFEDLFIMGLGKCVAHGIGGYGRLAAALSGGECVMRHRGDGGKSWGWRKWDGGNMNVCTQPTLSKNSQRMD